MECRYFEVILVSATNLPDVREFGQMKVYAKVSIGGDSDSMWVTPVDRANQTNPCWNCGIKYTLPEKAVKSEDTTLDIELYCERSVLEGKHVGKVNLSIKKLFDLEHLHDKIIELSVDRRDALGASGELKLWYSFASTKTLMVNRPSSRSGEGKLRYKVFKGALLVVKVAAEILLPGSSIVLPA